MEKIKHITSINQETLPENTADNHKIQYIDISSVSQTGKIEHIEQYTFKEAPSRARRKVRPGDTIISTVRTYLKAIARIENGEENLTCSTGFAVLTPKRIESKFLYYSCLSIHFIDEVCARSVGVSYPATTANEIGNISIPLPAISTQRAIATFLDKKTEAIDALIDKKQQLITLLEEQRVALINQAVTKGLDPDVPLKDSGVEWIGRIPEHWDISKLKNLITITNGQVDPSHPSYKNFPLIAPNHIQSGTRKITDVTTAEEQGAISGKYLVNSGEIIYSKIRPELRKVCIAPYKCLCSADMYPIKPAKQIHINFLTLVLLSDYFTDQVVTSAPRIAMPKVNREELSTTCIAYPPLAEQEAIAAYLDKELERQDAIIEKTRATIDKLTEYRQALITAAVTGQLHIGEPEDAEDGSPRGEPTDEGSETSPQLKLC